jgi:ribosomal protein S3AE
MKTIQFDENESQVVPKVLPAEIADKISNQYPLSKYQIHKLYFTFLDALEELADGSDDKGLE